MSSDEAFGLSAEQLLQLAAGKPLEDEDDEDPEDPEDIQAAHRDDDDNDPERGHE